MSAEKENLSDGSLVISL